MSPVNEHFYLDLQEELRVLRFHFNPFEGAQDAEMLDWARYFLEWSRKAEKGGQEWARLNLALAEKIVVGLVKPKRGTQWSQILSAAMKEAAQNISENLQTESLKHFGEDRSGKRAEDSTERVQP